MPHGHGAAPETHAHFAALRSLHLRAVLSDHESVDGPFLPGAPQLELKAFDEERLQHLRDHGFRRVRRHGGDHRETGGVQPGWASDLIIAEAVRAGDERLERHIVVSDPTWTGSDRWLGAFLLSRGLN